MGHIKKNMIQDPRFKIQEEGQLLVEAMIAISVLIIGVFGIFSLLNQSLGLNTIVTSQYIASNLAMEGVEVIKNLIDNNVLQGKAWNEGLATSGDDYEVEYNTNSAPLTPYSGKPLKFDSATGLYNYSTGNDTNFKRKVRLENIQDPSAGEYNEIRVNSIVSWTIKGGSYEINVENHFFNWR